MHHKHRRGWLAGIAGGLLVVAVAAAWMLWPQDGQPLPSPTPTAPLAQTAEQPTLSRGDVVRYAVHYGVCGHTRSYVEGIPEEWVGLTWDEAAKKAENWTAQPQSDLLSFRQEVDQYCPEHYILKLEEGVVAVYHNEAGWGELTRMSEHPLQTGNLDAETRQHLEAGMDFEDMDGLEGFLESINS